jgi:hypothetical protein
MSGKITEAFENMRDGIEQLQAAIDDIRDLNFIFDETELNRLDELLTLEYLRWDRVCDPGTYGVIQVY